jgi:VirE N-terminal domain
MPSPLDSITVNLFRGSTNPKPIEVLSLIVALDRIQNSTYQRPVQWLRTLFRNGRTRDYDRAKRHLDAVTFGGRFSPTRAKANLILHSGIVHGDMDHLANLEAARHSLRADPCVLYCFVSPSGTGIKVGVRIELVDDGDAYKHAWQAVADAHQQDYGLTWDPKGYWKSCEDGGPPIWRGRFHAPRYAVVPGGLLE